MRINCTIFGLDDDQETLDLIATYFDESGIDNYRLFTDREEFMMCFNGSVQIAIIDHYLAGMSVGFEVMKHIFELNEKCGALMKCKVIIMSGQQDPKMIAYYLNQGAFRYIDKQDDNFYDTLTDFVQLAIKEVDSFYQSVDKWESSMANINSILDLNKTDERSYNKDAF